MRNEYSYQMRLEIGSVPEGQTQKIYVDLPSGLTQGIYTGLSLWD